MKARLKALRESITTGFWFFPALGVGLALALALALVRVDRALDDGLGRFTFGAGPDGAREVLSAITSSMITFTGLVFSITIVVLQLTSSQFSPRVLRTFLRDRTTQVSLSVFVATFVYAVMVLRTVNSGGDSRFTPALSTTVGVALLLLSVGVFVGYIHHIATAIQVGYIVRTIGAETRRAISRVVPDQEDDQPQGVRSTSLAPVGGLPPRSAVVRAPRSGNVVSSDPRVLARLAQRAGVVLVVKVAVGEYVVEGMPLVDVHGDPGESLDVDGVRGAVALADDRTTEVDIAFGLRQLVDIAEKALSPGINDPTTAVQALDVVHDLLRRLLTRPLPGPWVLGEDGQPRVVLPRPDAADLLALALDEVEQYGADSLQVQQRVDRMLADLRDAARPEHLPAVLARQASRAVADSG